MFDTIIQFIGPFIGNLAAKFPIAVSLFALMGVLRVIFKPTFSYLRTIADATPSPKDNAALDKIEASKAYKFAEYILDFFASIKLPQK